MLLISRICEDSLHYAVYERICVISFACTLFSSSPLPLFPLHSFPLPSYSLLTTSLLCRTVLAKRHIAKLADIRRGKM